MSKLKVLFILGLIFSLHGFPSDHLEGISGEVIVLPVDEDLNEAKFASLTSKDRNYAVIGLPYVNQVRNFKFGNKYIRVIPFDYGESRITIKDQSKVLLNEVDKNRTFSESRIINNALNTHSENLNPDFDFIIPVNGIVSSRYGKKRFINDMPRSPHLALDIAAPEGTPVYAPSNGKVIQTGDYFYSGNYIMLDHGMGLISSYSHLNSINVATGDNIKKGMTIGNVGSTGRVTGPHLHWSVYLNKQRINPELLLDQRILLKTSNF